MNKIKKYLSLKNCDGGFDGPPPSQANSMSLGQILILYKLYIHTYVCIGIRLLYIIYYIYLYNSYAHAQSTNYIRKTYILYM